MDPITTITAIGAGLKLIEQFRETALRVMGKEGSEPSVTVKTKTLKTKSASGSPTSAGAESVELEIKRRGLAPEVVRPSDLKMGEWDQQRYDTLQSVVGTLFTQYNYLETQIVMTAGLQKIQMQQQMEELKKQLCPKFREMLRLYEQTLGIELQDHFALWSVCGQC